MMTLVDACRYGPQENGITVLAAAASTNYTIDLAAYGPLGVTPICVQSSAGTLYYKFSNDVNGAISTVATSGATRASAVSAAQTPLDMTPPKGFRYLIVQSSAIATIRVHGRGSYRPPNPLDLLHIYAEGDSNTALDAVSDPFAGTNRWWHQLQRLFAADSRQARFVANVAQSGSQWTVGSGLAPNPIISAPRQTALDGAANAGLINVLLIASSTNDANSLVDPLGTIQTNYRTWLDNRLAAGKNWLIVPVFLPPLQNAKNSVITSLNAWLPDLATVTESNRAVAVVAPRPTQLDNSGAANQDPLTGYYAPNSNTANADHYNGNGGMLVAREIYRVLRNISYPARP